MDEATTNSNHAFPTQSNIDTFEHMAQFGKKRFAIDYNQDDFRDYLKQISGTGCSTSALQNKILKNDLFNHFFWSIFTTRPFAKTLSSGEYCIPFECAFFFQAIFSTIGTSGVFHRAFKDGKHDLNEKQKDLFLHEVFNKIDKPLEIPEKSICLSHPVKETNVDSHTVFHSLCQEYTKRILYSEPLYQKHVTSKLWSEQIYPRIDKLLALSETIEPQQQLSVFSATILFLDQILTEISRTQPIANSDSSNTKKLSDKTTSNAEDILQFLPNFAEKLARRELAPPKPITRDSTPLPNKRYLIYNLPINNKTHKNIQSIFQDYSNGLKQDNDAVECARLVYINRIINNTPISGFQKTYEDIINYLNMSFTIEVATQYIRDQFRIHLTPIIEHYYSNQCFDLRTAPPAPPEFSFSNKKINYLVSEECSQIQTQYRSDRDYLTLVKHELLVLEKYRDYMKKQDTPKKADTEYAKTILKRITYMFNPDEAPSLFACKDHLSEEARSFLHSQLAPKGDDILPEAAAFWRIHPLDYEHYKEDLEQNLVIFDELLTNQSFLPPLDVVNCYYFLLHNVFLVVLKKRVEAGTKKILKELSLE